MTHLSCPIAGALPKDETSGQLQASTYSVINENCKVELNILVFTLLLFKFIYR